MRGWGSWWTASHDHRHHGGPRAAVGAREAIERAPRGLVEFETNTTEEQPCRVRQHLPAITLERDQQIGAARRQHAVPLEVSGEPLKPRVLSRRTARALEQRAGEDTANARTLLPSYRIVVRSSRVGTCAPPLGQRAAPYAFTIVQPRQRLENGPAASDRLRLLQCRDQAADDRRLMDLLQHAQRAAGQVVGGGLQRGKGRLDCAE